MEEQDAPRASKKRAKRERTAFPGRKKKEPIGAERRDRHAATAWKIAFNARPGGTDPDYYIINLRRIDETNVIEALGVAHLLNRDFNARHVIRSRKRRTKATTNFDELNDEIPR